MDSGQNHFRQSQQRINTIIVINGNVIVFSPEIITAPSCLLCPVPPESSVSSPARPASSHSFPSFLLCALLPLWPHFLLTKPVHHFFSFFPLNPIHPSKENPSQENFRSSDVPAASSLLSPLLPLLQHHRDVSYRSSQKQSPQIGSPQRAVSVHLEENLLQSTLR